MTTTAGSPFAESSPTAHNILLLAELARSARGQAKPFGRSARVAVGTGTPTAPTWLIIDLDAKEPARVMTQETLPGESHAALFLPTDGGQALVAGDRALLESVFRTLLGGMSMVGLRASLGEKR